MLWLNTHARSRKRLSPYIDGQLSPREKVTLDAHLAGCDACRRDFDELRATISAIGGLADADPPRSFALTPRVLEKRVAAPSPTVPPIATGMRLAGAGIALVLAIVMLGDLGGVGGGNSRDEGGRTRQAVEVQMNDFDNGGTAGGAPAPAATGAAEDKATIGSDRASPGDLAASAENADACTSSSGEARDATAVTPAAEAAPNAASAGGSIACAPAVEDVAPEAKTPADAEQLSADEARETSAAAAGAAHSEEGGSVFTLTILEIILAGGLLALVGAIGIEYMLRRRAA